MSNENIYWLIMFKSCAGATRTFVKELGQITQI